MRPVRREVGGGIVDALLRLRGPTRPVVGRHRGHPRNRASPDERTNVLDPLRQPPVQGNRPLGIEQNAGGVDHL